MVKNIKPWTCRGCGHLYGPAPQGAVVPWRTYYCSKECFMDFDSRWMPEPNSGCWLWLYGVSDTGYAHLRWPGFSTRQGHRISYEIHIGPIPKGLHLDHLCMVRSCVNPHHLEPVTNKINCERAPRIVNARKATHCKNGHPWTKTNTYIHPTKHSRVCRVCVYQSIEKYRQKKDEEKRHGRSR